MKHSIDRFLNATNPDGQMILIHLFNLTRFAGLVNESSKFGTEKIISILELYLTPIIIVVGILGNALSLAVFSLTHLRRISSSLFLTTLSVADIFFLSSLAFVWLEKVDILLYTSYGWCPAVMYVSRVSGCVAAWSVVSFTAERYVTVHYPLLKDVICTRKRAGCGAVFMLAASFIFYTYIAWSYQVIPMRGIAKSLCSPVARHPYFMSAMIGADTLLSCLIPTVVIVILNASIICKIRKYQQQNRGVAMCYCSKPSGRPFATFAQNYCRENVLGTYEGELRIRFNGQTRLRDCVSEDIGFHRVIEPQTNKQNRLKCNFGVHPVRDCRNSKKPSFSGNPFEHEQIHNQFHCSNVFNKSQHLRCYHSARHFSYHGEEGDFGDAHERHFIRHFRLASSEFQRMNISNRLDEAIHRKSHKSIMSSGCFEIEEEILAHSPKKDASCFSKFRKGKIQQNVTIPVEMGMDERYRRSRTVENIKNISPPSQRNIISGRRIACPWTLPDREIKETPAKLKSTKIQSALRTATGGARSPGDDRLRKALKNKNQYRTAKMLLTLSSLTVLLNLPTHAFRVQSVICDLIGSCRHFYQLSRLSQLIYFLNFAINFFVYNACARQFRIELRRLCSKTRLKFVKFFLLVHKKLKNYWNDKNIFEPPKCVCN